MFASCLFAAVLAGYCTSSLSVPAVGPEEPRQAKWGGQATSGADTDDTVVAMKVYVVTLERDTADHFLALAGFKELSGKLAVLTEDQVTNWLAVFDHDLVAWCTTTITPSHGFMVANGYAAELADGDQYALKAAAGAQPEVSLDRTQSLFLGVGRREESIKTALSGHITPWVSADHDRIGLDIDVARTSVYGSAPAACKLTVNENIAVPDGRTAVVYMGRARGENLYKCAVPVLSDLPYVGGLFAGGAYFSGERDVFLFVTPKVMSSRPYIRSAW
jgi:hypothetical protein